MSSGFSVPLTPLGRSSLAPAPPWHYAGSVLAIEYQPHSATMSSLLPLGLQPDYADAPAIAHFIEWQACTDSGEELIDPIRSQYREFFVTLPARLGDEPVYFCPFIYVDQDVSLMRGHVQGLPKKFGSVHLTRAYNVANPASSQLMAGQRHGGTLSVGGRRMAEATIAFDDIDTAPIGFATRPMIGVRHFPDLSKNGRDKPLVHDLVRFAATGREFGPVIGGDATLAIFDGPADELALVAPVSVGRGARYEMALSIDDLIDLGRIES